jgi:hypothetical protein
MCDSREASAHLGEHGDREPGLNKNVNIYCYSFTQMRDSGLPADVLVGKLKKDISFALRRGTIAQVTTALDAAQRAAEDELALNEAGWDR